ncbi:hypothetical protein D3C76_1333840 [compost metagenome]
MGLGKSGGGQRAEGMADQHAAFDGQGVERVQQAGGIVAGLGRSHGQWRGLAVARGVPGDHPRPLAQAQGHLQPAGRGRPYAVQQHHGLATASLAHRLLAVLQA